ncbi:MAG: hypothetical protein ABI778_08395 [Ignavibacteriota bacterium]
MRLLSGKYYHSLALGFLGLAVLSLTLISSAQGQPQETPDSVRFKTLGVLYRAISGLNTRNVRFKALQDELELMHPIEPQGMDSLHFAENLIQITKYLRFLETHRSDLTRSVRSLSDSIAIFTKLVTKAEEKKALADFLRSYKDESAQFIRYSQALSGMLVELKNTIVFLQTVPMTRNGMEITFNTDPSANQKYLDFQMKVQDERMKVDQEIDKSIALTEKENKVIQATLLLFNQ